MVKNLPSNARDMSLIPGSETKIPHAQVNKAHMLSSPHHN